MRDGPTPDILAEDFELDNEENALDGLFYENKKIDKYLNSDFERVAETSLIRLTPQKDDSRANNPGPLKMGHSVLKESDLGSLESPSKNEQAPMDQQ